MAQKLNELGVTLPDVEAPFSKKDTDFDKCYKNNEYSGISGFFKSIGNSIKNLFINKNDNSEN